MMSENDLNLQLIRQIGSDFNVHDDIRQGEREVQKLASRFGFNSQDILRDFVQYKATGRKLIWDEEVDMGQILQVLSVQMLWELC